MTDRELLEAAAKAYGVRLNQYQDEDFLRADHSPQGQHWNPRWNPLADDGEALRLAVKLAISVSHHGGTHLCETMDGEYLADEVDTTGDGLAATRRAIVRAAAAIASQA